MDFNQAIKELTSGKTITRKGWKKSKYPHSRYVKIVGGLARDFMYDVNTLESFLDDFWTPSEKDLTATDWSVLVLK